jgi:hypothetical protein
MQKYAYYLLYKCKMYRAVPGLRTVPTKGAGLPSARIYRLYS